MEEKVNMNDDSIKLLRECEAGIKMGISAIDDVIDDAQDKKLKSILTEGKDKHIELLSKAKEYLKSYNDEGKDASSMAKLMAKMKTNVKLMGGKADAGIADLITGGCDMGMKSLNRYINQYPAADAEIKKLTGEVILMEESLERCLRPYL